MANERSTKHTHKTKTKLRCSRRMCSNCSTVKYVQNVYDRFLFALDDSIIYCMLYYMSTVSWVFLVYAICACCFTLFALVVLRYLSLLFYAICACCFTLFALVVLRYLRLLFYAICACWLTLFALFVSAIIWRKLFYS